MQTLRHDERHGELDQLAAEVLAGRQVVGWCRSHEGLLSVRLIDGVLHTSSGPVDLDRVWSARIGADATELRWTREHDGGHATVLSLGDGGDGTPVVDTIGQRRVLWGAVAEVDRGWARLHETRIGSIEVPAPDGTQPSDRLALRTLELVTETAATYAEHATDAGNRAVIEELLVGIVRLDDGGAR